MMMNQLFRHTFHSGARATLATFLLITAAHALTPPAGFTAAVRHADIKLRDCTSTALPYTDVLDFPSKYEGSGSSRDTLNARAEALYRERTAPISALERGVSEQADDYLRGGNTEALECALGLLDTWASVGGLLGPSSTHTGRSVRKWTLGSVASSYLRLKYSVSAPLRNYPEQARRIEAWMGKVADIVVQEWSNAPLEKTNNHEYWAAWAVMATAHVLDRRDLFNWAMARFKVATGQIDEDGYLPNELKRGTRALHYHNYALTPLAMLAAFAKANGNAPTGQETDAINRLADRVLAGVDSPSIFKKRTGKKQVEADLNNAASLVWLEPYCWTFVCSDDVTQRLENLRSLKSYRLGGNLSTIFSQVP